MREPLWVHHAPVLATLLLAGAISACERTKVPPATVMFDEAHGQRFLIEHGGPLDLSGLAATFRDQQLLIKTSRQDVTDSTLSGVVALVISGPFAPVRPAEIDAIGRFLERGGRLCVMLHIAPPVAALLHQLNVSISNGVIRERENVIGDDPLNFHVTGLTAHALTTGVHGFDVFGAWALLPTGDTASIIAHSSPRAWVDLNGNQALDDRDATQSFGVIVAGQFGAGGFVVFGDDAVFQNRFLTGGNVTLAQNVARWLGKRR
jgi:hypothetical protein